MRILIVDDAEESRDVIEASLLSGGYRDVVGVESGWAALKYLDIGGEAKGFAGGADIILLDIMMPEIDGIETCARIRRDERYVDTPIIMVTSLDDMESLGNAFVAGASDYVTKPVNRIELIARVRAALRLKGELDRRLARERELLDFLSHWGDRHATGWIEEATGLFIGEVAEAYLTAVTERHPKDHVSVLALAIDRLDILRAAQGDDAASGVLAKVGAAIRSEAASIGVVAAAYRSGVVILIVPRDDAQAARAFAERLRSAVARLALANRESIASDRVTASVSIATGRGAGGVERVKLLTQAIFNAEKAAATGGDRVVAVNI